jgi:hypothetical protein
LGVAAIHQGKRVRFFNAVDHPPQSAEQRNIVSLIHPATKGALFGCR